MSLFNLSPTGRRGAGLSWSRAVGPAALMMVCGGAMAQAPNCTQVPAAGCLYVPVLSHGTVDVERTTSYTDEAGALRELRMLIRQPTGAAAPTPVVVWSHGGAGGKNDPANSMPEWSSATARAGYFTVSIAHTPRSDNSRQQLCQAIGIADRAACKVFKHLNWDRPHDIRAVLTALQQMNAAGGEFAGAIDIARVAVGGHSAGSGGAQTVAGARRTFGGAPLDLSDARPIAFLAFSPQQPGTEGFFDTRQGKPQHSWSHVQRPVLTVTGDGDSGCNPGPEPGSCIGDTPYGRRIGYQRMPPGGKYQLYVHDADSYHTLFELNTGKCNTLAADPAQCLETARWIQSAGLAFLDGHLKQSPNALQWLQGRHLELASGGVAEWLRK